MKKVFAFFQILISSKSIKSSIDLRKSEEQSEFWEENIWLFIILIIIVIILLIILIFLSIKIYKILKKNKIKNNDMINTESSSYKYISEYNKRKTKKLKYNERKMEIKEEI